jgi:arylsulfatase A-like enzyme
MICVDIDDELYRRLQETAKHMGTTPEKLLHTNTRGVANPLHPRGETRSRETAKRTRLRMNIALIIIDTLRADHADPLYHEAQKQGWTTAKAIAPATWTLPSHTSMITGLYPSQHGVDERAPPTQDAKRAHVALKATDHGILGKLRRESYHIYILTANPHLTPTSASPYTTTYTSYAGHHKNLPRPHTKQLEPPKSRPSPHKAERNQNPQPPPNTSP